MCHTEDDPHVVYVGRGDGTVCLVDFRQKTGSEQHHYEWSQTTHRSRVNSMQIHPTQAHLLVSSGAKTDGCIFVHDLRKRPSTSKGNGVWKPIITIREHTKSTNAMAISPDGLYMVSVGQDNKICTYTGFDGNDSNKLKCVKTYHDNHTGRW
jgi:WD40 repeat protein